MARYESIWVLVLNGMWWCGLIDWTQECLADDRVVLVSIDGLRGEEVFSGIDRRLVIPELGCKQPDQLLEEYWNTSPEVRRQRLMPFLWSRIDSEGWIAGDVDQESFVVVTNGKYFSYPGYNELLAGFADPRIDSNAKRPNPNQTVLEWLNARPGFEGKVQAFCSWDVFPYIIHEARSGVPVNAGWKTIVGPKEETNEALQFLNDHLHREWDEVRYDTFTALGALQAIRHSDVRCLYVALGEPDDWAHAGRYDRYITSARACDTYLRLIWEAVEANENYAGKTSMLIATDHGRGDGIEGWKNHSASLPGSERVWIAAWGPQVKGRGIHQQGEFQQAQVAATVAALVGEDYVSEVPQAAHPIQDIVE